MLRLPDHAYLEMIGLALDGYPLEVCGLLAGKDDRVEVFYPCRNAAQSARVYEIDGRDYMHADRDAEARGFELLGVMHSHTHTDAYPSPTDIDQAPDPAWHYAIVSLREAEPVLRSYRIVGDGKVEEPVVVERRGAGTILD
ncbi:MAG TPA: M67 family metallopeptidase [Acidimicrobiales bacterium]|jgi:proteasome lid subunit RPN8/RPN11|nr:M67 family metallopeptidase [Acidimicrobiales bacterium]